MKWASPEFSSGRFWRWKPSEPINSAGQLKRAGVPVFKVGMSHPLTRWQAVNVHLIATYIYADDLFLSFFSHALLLLQRGPKCRIQPFETMKRDGAGSLRKRG